MQASTRGTTSRWIGSMPSTFIASISSRILREPRSAEIAEPPAPAISSAVTIGAGLRTMASTVAAPVNDCAPNCWISAADLQRDHRAERDRDQRRRARSSPWR